MNNNTGELH